MHIYLNGLLTEQVISKLKAGDIIELEMPPFCSGDYSLKIFEDTNKSLYVKENWIKGCRGFGVKRNKKVIIPFKFTQ